MPNFSSVLALGINSAIRIAEHTAVDHRVIIFQTVTSFPLSAPLCISVFIVKQVRIIGVSCIGHKIKVQNYSTALSLKIVKSHFIVIIGCLLTPTSGFIVLGDYSSCLIT